MLRTRVIPIMLLSGRRFVKTVKFKNRIYIGDPINTVKLFNDKEVDELAIVDIDASQKNKSPDFEYIEKVASQCFMPLAYGGGIKTADQAFRLLGIGVEKVILSSAAIHNPAVINEIAMDAGSQSVVICIDVKKDWLGRYQVKTLNGTKKTNLDLVSFASEAVDRGAGELIINSIDRDGTQSGYDLDLLNKIISIVNVPVIACGGAGSLLDFSNAVKCGVSALAAGSMFVFHGPHKAVLINYPKYSSLQDALGDA
jgi:cyclase